MFLLITERPMANKVAVQLTFGSLLAWLLVFEHYAEAVCRNDDIAMRSDCAYFVGFCSHLPSDPLTAISCETVEQSMH